LQGRLSTLKAAPNATASAGALSLITATTGAAVSRGRASSDAFTLLFSSGVGMQVADFHNFIPSFKPLSRNNKVRAKSLSILYFH
jgi:hypothetical protein